MHILRQPIVPGGWLICFGFVQPSHAHDQQHPEWIEWLMSQKDQYNGDCCTGEDVIVLEDNEWAMKKDEYEVYSKGTGFRCRCGLSPRGTVASPARRFSGSGSDACSVSSLDSPTSSDE